ncbi:MAG: TetR/AcrR family transcriptional regulator [Rudaea sp.]|uniref:TetR/AcrR family transcriptional regulator n=1 Tax=Rudaea sp. TaxID=2136325 RepID=UPI0039E3F38D
MTPTPKPRTRRTQAERREETTSRILEAAVGELRAKGYAGFRVNEIVRVADVSKGALTHHFPTKESLVIAALKRIYENSHARSTALLKSLGPTSNVYQVLDVLMQDSEAFYLGKNFAIAVTMLGVGDDVPQLRRQVRSLSRHHRLPIEQEWLAALLRTGLPEKEARGLLFITQSVFRGMVMRQFLRADPNYMEFTASYWRELALAHIAKVLQDTPSAIQAISVKSARSQANR